MRFLFCFIGVAAQAPKKHKHQRGAGTKEAQAGSYVSYVISVTNLKNPIQQEFSNFLAGNFLRYDCGKITICKFDKNSLNLVS